MPELEIGVAVGPVRVIPVLVTTTDQLLLAGPCKLAGYSLRDATGDLNYANEGNATSPGAAGVILTITPIVAGTYQVAWSVGLEGTLAAGDANNFVLTLNGVNQLISVNGFAPGEYPQAPFELTIPNAANVSVKAIAAGTVGAIYSAQVTLTPVASGNTIVELQDGNNPLAEIGLPNPGAATQWYGDFGLHVRNRINLHVVSGAVTGAVYAKFQRGT